MDAALGGDEQHRRFLNGYYGVARHFYDATRKYYLFGRDGTLAELEREPWTTLVEVGPGTGRNLRKLHAACPDRRLGGVDASDAMLAHARKRCPFATLVHGFAERAPFESVMGERPDRILFSYCLSMVAEPGAALARARASLAPGGQVVVVDFADLEGLPRPARTFLRAWVGAYHVRPLRPELVEPGALRVQYGPGRYFVRARFGPL
jgi:S-adenosylmethionine-diacylgycerolhomoserine-N-methlytransferase